MIPGYNHNIRYRGDVYHVQTEDSGLDNPHIITLLFLGGNIIESRKTSYADIAKTHRLSDVLVEIMQDQHKAMLRDLISGKLDARIAERSANAATLNGPEPINVAAGAQGRSSFRLQAVDKAKERAAAAPSAVRAKAVPRAPTPLSGRVASSDEDTEAKAPVPVVARPAEAAPAASAARPTAAVRPATHFAPPPAASSKVAPAGYRWPSARPTGAPPPAAAPRVGGAPPAAAVVVAAASAPKAAGAVHGQHEDDVIQAETLQLAFESTDAGALASIFGEDPVNQKSLDDVILSYLAEETQR